MNRRRRTGRTARRLRVTRFNLLEVMLGLAVIAFGLVSVLALLPASLKAGRDSVAETHSAQSAEHLIQLLSSRLERAATQEAWDTLVNRLPASKPGTDEPTSGWERWLDMDGVVFWRVGTSSPYFRMEMRREGAATPEFAGICRAWRERATISTHTDGSWSTVTLPYEDAITLHVEVSWPPEIPYVRRSKSLYALNVFRTVE